MQAWAAAALQAALQVRRPRNKSMDKMLGWCRQLSFRAIVRCYVPWRSTGTARAAWRALFARPTIPPAAAARTIRHAVWCADPWPCTSRHGPSTHPSASPGTGRACLPPHDKAVWCPGTCFTCSLMVPLDSGKFWCCNRSWQLLELPKARAGTSWAMLVMMEASCKC